jgi:uncharacterized peroxidase-related enzyme
MKNFTLHTEATAPEGAAEVLGQVRERYGFIPNLAAYIAESPAALQGLLGLAGAFDQTSFTEVERQLIQLTVSVENNCNYCRSAHTAMASGAGMDGQVVEDILAQRPLAEGRLEALREFTRTLVEERGWAKDEAVNKFIAAGFTKAQVFEVVMGIALKTLTNYSNHLADAQPNPEFTGGSAEPAVKESVR